MGTLEQERGVQLDPRLLARMQEVFLSVSVSDRETLETIKTVYDNNRYTLCPHSATAVYALDHLPELHALTEGRSEGKSEGKSGGKSEDRGVGGSRSTLLSEQVAPVVAVLTAHPAKFEDACEAAGVREKRQRERERVSDRERV